MEVKRDKLFSNYTWFLITSFFLTLLFIRLLCLAHVPHFASSPIFFSCNLLSRNSAPFLFLSIYRYLCPLIILFRNTVFTAALLFLSLSLSTSRGRTQAHGEAATVSEELFIAKQGRKVTSYGDARRHCCFNTIVFSKKCYVNHRNKPQNYLTIDP